MANFILFTVLGMELHCSMSFVNNQHNIFILVYENLQRACIVCGDMGTHRHSTRGGGGGLDQYLWIYHMD